MTTARYTRYIPILDISDFPNGNGHYTVSFPGSDDETGIRMSANDILHFYGIDVTPKFEVGDQVVEFGSAGLQYEVLGTYKDEAWVLGSTISGQYTTLINVRNLKRVEV